MTYDLNRGGDRTTEPADDDVIVGIPASGAPYTTSWSRVKGWIRRALSSTTPVNTSTASAGTSDNVAREDHDHGIVIPTVPAPSGTAPGNTPGSASAGTSALFSRGDHDHGITPGTGGGSGPWSDAGALIDDIDDDTGGDIDFSRRGSGSTADLRGTIRDGSVSRAMITNKSVNTAKLADDAVTNAKIADDAVDTDQLADDAVTKDKLADNSVGTNKISNGAVTQAKIKSGVVGLTRLDSELQTTLGRVPSASPGNNKVWKTDGSGSPGWREDATSSGGSGEENVQSDWEVTDTTSDAFIKNKPTLPTEFGDKNVQSDWEVTDTTSDAFIKNKPTLPTEFGDLLVLADADAVNALADTKVNADANLLGKLIYVISGSGRIASVYPNAGDFVRYLGWHDTFNEPLFEKVRDFSVVAAHTPDSDDRELAGLDIGGIDYEIVDDEARERLHEVEQRVHPIVETDRTWADVTDSAVAGWSAPSVLLTSLASIAGLTYSNTNVADNVDRFVYVRIPVGEKQSNYRFQYTIGGGQQAGETHNRVLGTWSGEKVAVDSNWQYFSISFYEGSTFSAGKVQLGTGEYEWDAAVTKKAVYDQVSEIVKAGSNVTAVNSDSDETVTLSSSGGGAGASAFSELTGQIAATQIPDDVITRAKIGSAAVGATELGTSSVTTVKLDDDAVTTDKLANSINTVLGRVPSASPGNNQVWKTDGSGSPGWRPDATGGGSVAASPQELTPGTSTLQVGGATLGTAMPDNASTQIPITSVGTGTLASGLSSNNFTLKAGAYLIFVHLDEIWNTTSTTNALQYRSIVALEITGTLPAGAVHDPMPHYFRGAIQDDPAEAAGQAYVYLPEDTEIGLALVGYPGVGEDTGNADRNLNYHCTVDQVHIFPMGGVKGDKGDKGDVGTGASSFSELTGQIAASQIPGDVVTTAKIADDAVTRAKIGSQAVGSGELGNSAVTTAKLDDVAVTTAKIADDAVTADKIADGVIPTIPDSDEVYGSNTIRKDDTGVLKLRAPDLHSGFWGRSGDDNIVPLGADDPANAVPARLTEVRSNDTRSTAKLSDVVYEATGPQGSPEVEGTIKVLHSTGTFVHDFGSGTGYDATKPGFTWDSTNNRFAHNGVVPSVANSGSTTNKFRLRVEVDYMHHVTVGTSEFSMQLDIDVPQRYGVDRQHQWHNVSTDLGDNEVRTLSYQVDISATSAPATTDHLTVKLTSLQLGSQVEFVEAVRIHFILPDSANISYLQEYDLNNAVSWVGRNVLGPALGSHTDNQSNAGVKITGGRMIATEDLATLQLISNARTAVAGNGHNIRLMTRIPGLQVPIVLHEWDDSTNVWRIVETIKGVVQEQEFWVEADSGATYSSVGSPNFVWDSTKHDSDANNNLLYPGLIEVVTQTQYDALSWVNPYQIYAISG